jgi:hypothetical protein
MTTARTDAFAPQEILLAVLLAGAMEMGLFLLFIVAGENAMKVKDAAPVEPSAMPIKVMPVLDDAPLLKLGGKKVKTKLPEMWKKNPPVQRFQESSAPSPHAAKTPDSLPTSQLAKFDAEAPPPDAEVAKEVDQTLLDAGPDAAPTAEGEGVADGVKEGTETDPLKARAVSQYMAKLQAWFSRGFDPSKTGIPCEELKKLTAAVTVSVGGSREVAGFTLSRASGNAAFDAAVQSRMQGAMGQELPPPPPLYPDIVQQTVRPVFSGRNAQCE